MTMPPYMKGAPDMKHMTVKPFRSVLLCFLACVAVCSLVGCRLGKEADAWLAFMTDTQDGAYNAILMEWEENNKITFFMGEDYGLWEKDGKREIVSFYFWEQPSTSGPTGYGDMYIYLITPEYYYYATAHNSYVAALGVNPEYDGGKRLFDAAGGNIAYSEDGSTATVSEGSFGEGVVSTSPSTVTMSKVRLPDEELVSLVTAIEEQHFVNDAYFEFIKTAEGDKFVLEEVDLWVDATTMVGEWTSGGKTLPVRLHLSDKVPYLAIYDLSNDREKLIFSGYGSAHNTVQNGSALPITHVEAYEMFYTRPEYVTLKKVAGE